MDGSLSRRQDTKVDDSWPAALDKHQRPEIAIAGHENAALLVRDAQQFSICGLCQTKLAGSRDIMPQSTQKANSRSVDVLVGEEDHGVVARWISSAATTSIAY